MDTKFLGQGFRADNADSVGAYITRFLIEKKFHTFTGITAFASYAGIRGFSKSVKKAKNDFDSLNLIVGIDQKGTSKEALEAVLALKINSYIYYQPSRPIFHPKIYLFEGDEKSKLIVGSSNLTSQGLFQNIEASLLIQLENDTEADIKLIQELKDYFDSLFSFKDPNLQKINQKLIDDLVTSKLVPTEAERKTAYGKVVGSQDSKSKKLILSLFPKRKVVKIPPEFTGSSKKKAKAAKKKKPTKPGTPSAYGKLVWRRRSLPASSVQIAAPGTNPTGGLRLVQDRFIDGGHVIDQTQYFRRIVFGRFSWSIATTTPFVEVAEVPFEVTIKGSYLGKFKLEVRHKPTGEAGQHNYTTSISWGEIGEDIRLAALTGARLELYAPKSKRRAFGIQIS